MEIILLQDVKRLGEEGAAPPIADDEPRDFEFLHRKADGGARDSMALAEFIIARHAVPRTPEPGLDIGLNQPFQLQIQGDGGVWLDRGRGRLGHL